MAIPTIPQILTQADWNQQKGVIAKMAGETGIGAQMAKVKTAYDAVDWGKFDAKLACQNTKDVKVVDDALAAAKAEHAKVENVRKELRVLEDLAKKTQAKFKSNPVIPSSSADHVGKIATAADHMAVACKSMDAEFKGFEEMKKRIIEIGETSKKALQTYLVKCQAGISQVNAKPTYETFEKFWKENIRGLSAALALQKDLSAHHAAWKTMSGDAFKPKKDADANAVKTKVKEVEAALNKLKAAVK